MITMLFVTVPPTISQAAVRDAVQRSTELGDGARGFASIWSPKLIGLSLTGLATLLRPSSAQTIFDALLHSTQRGANDGGRMPPRPPSGPAVTPGTAAPRAEREGRVATLKLNTGDDLLLESRQRMFFSAVPVDNQGATIHGLHAEWESNNTRVIFIEKNGQAIAGRPGNAILTATAGRSRQTVRVRVVEGDRDEFGGRKKPDSTTPRKATSNTSSQSNGVAVSKTGKKRQHPFRIGRSAIVKASSAEPMMPQHGPNDDPLPDDQTSSLYQASNSVGSPPGKTVPGAGTHGAALVSTENPGSQNFTFGLPVFSLPGRGIDAALSLVHNSQLFNKSIGGLYGTTTFMTYDVDSGWPAPGWRLGYGQIENQGGYGLTLTDADGTRHALVVTANYEADTTDGTFIHYSGSSGAGTLYYPDGRQVVYGAGGGGYRIYPTKITDANGNYLAVSYVGGVGPKISSIEDTLQRYVNFYYASNGDLVTITAPGFGTQSERAVMRLYYDTVSITTTGLFDSGLTVAYNTPASVRAIKYIYLPDSSESSGDHMGYRFDYTSYGMMYQATQFRGMSASWTSYTDAGSNPSEGTNTTAAVTTYNYEGTPNRSIPSGGLTDLPDYTQRADEWAGRTTGGDAPSYSFSSSTATNQKIFTVTAPDGTITESRSNDKPGDWDDGLVTDTYVKYVQSGSTIVMWHTNIEWDPNSTSNPRVYKVRTTNGPGGLTKATVLSYTTYNNVSAVSECGFTTSETGTGAEVRRTEMTYETSSSYTNRHLLNLPLTVKVFEGSATTPSSRVDYEYDNYSSSQGGTSLTARDDIIMHDPAFDPYQPTQQINCHWVCTDREGHTCYEWEWVCTPYNPYDAATDKRGNATKVTTYLDATSSSGTIEHKNTYDIAGNVMTAQVDCCRSETISYSNGSAGHDYAYPVSVTSGDPNGLHVTTSATYDLHTGLVGTTTDENGNVTTNYYSSDSLRLSYITDPNGRETHFYYNDGLWADSAGHRHYFTNVSTKIDSSSTTNHNWSDVYRLSFCQMLCTAESSGGDSLSLLL